MPAGLYSFWRLKERHCFLVFSTFTGCPQPLAHGSLSSVWPLLLLSPLLWIWSPACLLEGLCLDVGPSWVMQDYFPISRSLTWLHLQSSFRHGRYHIPRFYGWGRLWGSIILSITAMMLSNGEGQGEDHFNKTMFLQRHVAPSSLGKSTYKQSWKFSQEKIGSISEVPPPFPGWVYMKWQPRWLHLSLRVYQYAGTLLVSFSQVICTIKNVVIVKEMI